MGLPPHLLKIFAEYHRDLFGVQFWQQMQVRHRAGETIDLFPYDPEKRLLNRLGGLA
jgi:isocitrate dehydrogenase kinase/phosphatase